VAVAELGTTIVTRLVTTILEWAEPASLAEPNQEYTLLLDLPTKAHLVQAAQDQIFSTTEPTTMIVDLMERLVYA
jgi:hypothetical protein